MEAKGRLSKISNLKYNELRIQKYLKNSKISVDEAKRIFAFRQRMADFEENFKGKHKNYVCVLCSVTNETQEHSFICSEVTSRIKISGNYNDIFEENISERSEDSLRL